jgi:uncharacterized peroxidase-related enzyme
VLRHQSRRQTAAPNDDEETIAMQHLTPSGLPVIEEEEATGEVARIYDDIKREMQIPFVPNGPKALAISPGSLAIYWDLMRSFYQHITLPQSLTAMALFTIAKTNHCQYCSATNELVCRQLGVDEETLDALVEDLTKVYPQRVRAIIEFAVKASRDPQGLLPEDYERVRAQGVTDEELVETIFIAALGKYFDTLADALKIEVDPAVAQALGR